VKSKVLSFLWVLLLLTQVSQAAFASNLIDEPKSCLKNLKFPCAVRAIEDGQSLSLNGFEINFSSGTNLLLASQQKLQLLDGKIWLRGGNEIEVTTGSVHFIVNGDIWIEELKGERVFVRNMDGRLKVSSALTEIEQQIPVGFENWYALLNTKGALQQGVLKTIEPRRFLTDWSKISHLSKSQVIESVQAYKEKWKGNVEASAQLYQEVVNRQLASVQELELEKARRAREKEAQQAKLREMYRSRFEDR